MQITDRDLSYIKTINSIGREDGTSGNSEKTPLGTPVEMLTIDDEWYNQMDENKIVGSIKFVLFTSET